MVQVKTFHGQAACILDADGCFVNVSPSLAAFFRTDAERLRGRSLTECMERAEAAQVEPLLAGLGQGGNGTYRFQVRLLGHGAMPTWVGLRLEPGGTDAEGRPLTVAIFEDPSPAS